MEGVIVSAKREGSTITVSVVSDAQGQYSFPEDRLEPGKYAISIRAVGYDLASPGSVDLTAERPAHLDLQLKKTRRLSAQLSNGEWLMSVPGSQAEKQRLGCTTCHTLQRVLTSRYEADEMTKVVQRMRTHTINSTPTHLQVLHAAPERLNQPPTQAQVDLGQYISTINLSAADTWQFLLKTLPRPTGKATQVIITTYDLPRPDTAPHDAMMDAEGNVWYSDFVSPYMGKLEPETGNVTEYKLPIQKPTFATGGLDIAIDKDGRIYGYIRVSQMV